MSISQSPSLPPSPTSEIESKRKPPRRKPGLGLLLTLLLAGGGAGFAYWYNSRSSEQTQQSAAPQAATVQIQTVKSGNVEDSSSYVGTLDATKAVVLRPKTTGRVTQIYVSEGTRVQPGKPIVELSPERTRAELNSAIANINASRSARDNANAQLAEAKAQLNSAIAEVQLQNEEFQRTSTLVAQGALAQQSLDRVRRDREAARAAFNAAQQRIRATQASFNQANATLAQSEANANAVREDVQDTRVVAPIAGIVGDIPIKLGDYVDVGDELTTITQNQTLELDLTIPLNRSDELKIGTPVELYRFQQADKPIATGKISFISPRADDNSQTVLAKATFDNPNGLQNRQKVEARVIWDERSGVLIPTSSISRIAGQNFVFVAQEQKDRNTGKTQVVARQKLVKLGNIQNNQYQVIEGLKPGERLITSGLLNLTDGAIVSSK
ncbi:MAG: efflux RND transporter periplasmic adaptor subunit [Xenococcaceae cyanobacterium]